MGNPYDVEIQAGDAEGPIVVAGALTFTDSGNQPGGGGGGLTPTAVLTNADSPYQATAGQLVLVDLSGGAVTVTLPASPTPGEQVGVYIVNQASNNALTVDPGMFSIIANGSVAIAGRYTTLVLTFDGDTDGEWVPTGGPLPLGWTQDGAVPAGVAIGAGSLTADDGTSASGISSAGVYTAADATSEDYSMSLGSGVVSASPAGIPAFRANVAAGATVALDAGGLDITNAGTVTAATVDATTCGLTPGTPGDDVLFCNDGAVTGFSAIVPNVVPAITGALSTVIDAAAKDVLTSIIAALVGVGLATDGTT